MENNKNGRRGKRSNFRQWILASTAGVLFLTWFFSTVDRRTTEERIADTFEETASKARLEEKINQPRGDIHADVLKDIKNYLNESNILYTNVEVSQNQFVWVHISSTNSAEADFLASRLCVKAKKHFMKGVTIFDSRGDTIGRSICK